MKIEFLFLVIRCHTKNQLTQVLQHLVLPSSRPQESRWDKRQCVCLITEHGHRGPAPALKALCLSEALTVTALDLLVSADTDPHPAE